MTAAVLGGEDGIQAAVDRAANAITHSAFFIATARAIPTWRMPERIAVDDMLHLYLDQAKAEEVGNTQDRHERALSLWWRHNLRKAADVYVESQLADPPNPNPVVDDDFGVASFLRGMFPEFAEAQESTLRNLQFVARDLRESKPVNATPDDVRNGVPTIADYSKKWVYASVGSVLVWDDLLYKWLTRRAEDDARPPARKKGQRKRHHLTQHVPSRMVVEELDVANRQFLHELNEIVEARRTTRELPAAETIVQLQWLPFGRRVLDDATERLAQGVAPWARAKFRSQRLEVLNIVALELGSTSAIWGDPLDIDIAYGLPRAKLRLDAPDAADQVAFDQYVVLRARHADGRTHSLVGVSPVTIQNGIYVWVPSLDESVPLDPANQVFAGNKTDAHRLYNARMLRWVNEHPPVVDEVYVAAARILEVVDDHMLTPATFRTGWPAVSRIAGVAYDLAEIYKLPADPPLSILSSSRIESSSAQDHSTL